MSVAWPMLLKQRAGGIARLATEVVDMRAQVHGRRSHQGVARGERLGEQLEVLLALAGMPRCTGGLKQAAGAHARVRRELGGAGERRGGRRITSPGSDASRPAVSSWEATASSGPSRGGGVPGTALGRRRLSARALAAARCAARRSDGGAAWKSAERTSGCRNANRPSATLTRPTSSAGSSAAICRSASALASASTSPVESAAAITSARRAAAGSEAARSTNAAPGVAAVGTGSVIGSVPASCPRPKSRGNSVRASGFPSVAS